MGYVGLLFAGFLFAAVCREIGISQWFAVPGVGLLILALYAAQKAEESKPPDPQKPPLPTGDIAVNCPACKHDVGLARTQAVTEGLCPQCAAPILVLVEMRCRGHRGRAVPNSSKKQWQIEIEGAGLIEVMGPNDMYVRAGHYLSLTAKRGWTGVGWHRLHDHTTGRTYRIS